MPTAKRLRYSLSALGLAVVLLFVSTLVRHLGLTFVLFNTSFNVFFDLLLIILIQSAYNSTKWSAYTFYINFIIAAGFANIFEFIVYHSIADYLPGFFNTKANIPDYIIGITCVLIVIKLLTTKRSIAE